MEERKKERGEIFLNSEKEKLKKKKAVCNKYIPMCGSVGNREREKFWKSSCTGVDMERYCFILHEKWTSQR